MLTPTYTGAHHAITAIREQARENFSAEDYERIFVPRLQDLVKMSITKRGLSVIDQHIEVEFEVDWDLFKKISAEHKPLDDRTLVEAINAINARIQEEGNRLGFVRGLQDARDTLSRMRATA